VTRVLGSRYAGVFAGALQHVPAGTVQALRLAMRDAGADCLVSVGGGSPIDTAKAAAHAILADRGGGPAADGPVHIAIPTTLSAAEFTDVAGMTDEATRVKHALSDPRIAPRTAIADPVLTLETPDWLWAASGIRALDHAVETLYASRLHPIGEPLAVRAIELLLAHLPRSMGNGHPVRRGGPSAFANASADKSGPPDNATAHRGECQMAAWLAVFGLTNAGFGLSHVLGHQIGPRWNVAHGVTSAIVLPHAMRFMAAAAPERFAPIARGLGLDVGVTDASASAGACAARVEAFIAQFNLPTRLRDVGVQEDEMGDIATHVCEALADSHTIDRTIERADLMSILTSAY
jgi:alcohol dehydrogenase